MCQNCHAVSFIAEYTFIDSFPAESPAASNQHSTDHAGTPQAGASHSQFGANSNDPDSPQNKRRPGRPKGSRNRKPRESGGKPQHAFHNYPPPPAGAPTLPGVTPQNQQYYEFQWRVLNLCSEFYGAAEELVVSASSQRRTISFLTHRLHRKPHHHWSSPNHIRWARRTRLIRSKCWGRPNGSVINLFAFCPSPYESILTDGPSC